MQHIFKTNSINIIADSKAQGWQDKWHRQKEEEYQEEERKEIQEQQVQGGHTGFGRPGN